MGSLPLQLMETRVRKKTRTLGNWKEDEKLEIIVKQFYFHVLVRENMIVFFIGRCKCDHTCIFLAIMSDAGRTVILVEKQFLLHLYCNCCISSADSF